MKLYLGIDFGTSGARAVVINTTGDIQAEAQYPFKASVVGTGTAASWQTALFALIEQIPQELRWKSTRSQLMALLPPFCYAMQLDSPLMNP
jgi:sugar (pentulose or hexulose) kinase